MTTLFTFAINRNSYPYVEEYFNANVKFFNAKSCIYSPDEDFVLDPKVTYVFFSLLPSRFSGWDNDSHKKIILINLDQLSTKNGCGDSRISHIKSCFEKGIRVLTHGLSQKSENLVGKKMIHFPTIADDNETSELKKMMSNDYQYDIAVCGGMTPYRLERIALLEKAGLKITKLGNDWKEARDRKIASAKILLNLHAFEDYDIHESIRCDRWLAAGKIIVSEPSCLESYHGSDKFMFVSKFEEMADLIKNILANFDQYQTGALSKLDLFEKLNFEKKIQCQQAIETFSIGYGANGTFKDFTGVAFKKIVGNYIIVPPGDRNREGFFLEDPCPNVLKSVSVTHNGHTVIYDHTYVIRIEVTDNLVKLIDAFVPEEKIATIHSGMKFDGDMKRELPEQLMSLMYVRPNAKVLELGSNIGRNTCIIGRILADSKDLVTMETIIATYKHLERNRVHSNLNFRSVNAALSYRPLIQAGWESKPHEGEIPKNFCAVQIKSYQEVESENNIQFDTFVADCEGALYYIFQDYPDMLDNIDTVIMENDYNIIAQKQLVDSVLTSKGLRRVYNRSGGWGPCFGNFYEVWQRYRK
jgi:hypothetical protein